MFTVRSVQPRDTYRQYFVDLFKYIIPPNSAQAKELHIVMDTYKSNSTRYTKEGKRIHVSGFDQKMPRGNKWVDILSNNSNKADLINLLFKYVESGAAMKLTENLVLKITENENTWQTENGRLLNIFKCNHEEADTRMIFHASLSINNVVIVTNDTDVLVLMVNSFEKLQPVSESQMKFEFYSYANIRSICDKLGSSVCRFLPHFYSITGCDTTSYFYNVGKRNPFNKVLSHPEHLELLTSLGLE